MLTSGGGLLFSRDGRDLKINFHLNGTNFDFKVNFTSSGGEEEEESEKTLARLDAGDFCLIQVKSVWGVFNTFAKYWQILPNIKILANIGKYCQILPNIGKYEMN